MKSEEEEDEDDFQENLKKLDAKIFNVKQTNASFDES